MRYLISIFIFAIFTDCARKPITSSVPANDKELSESSSYNSYSSNFNFEKAEVFEKTGRSEEVTDITNFLYASNLLSREDYERLSNKINTNTLSGNFEIIRAIKNSIPIYTDSINSGFPVFYESIYSHLKDKNNLVFTNYKADEKTLIDTVEGIKESISTISFNALNKTFAIKVKADSAGAKQLDESFYKIINDVKTARGDSSRLYLFRKILVLKDDSLNYYTTDTKEYRLVPLTRDQAMYLHQYPNAIDLSYEEHRQPLKKEQISKAFTKLSAGGFFNNIKEEDYSVFLKKSEESLLFETSDLFYTIEPLRICLNANTDFKTKPYNSIINSLKAFSQNRFNPSNIKEVSSPNSAGEVSFELNNKKFSGSFYNSFDQIDLAGFMDFINASLNKAGVNGNFYILNNPDRARCYIFMTEEQLNTANNLLEE